MADLLDQRDVNELIKILDYCDRIEASINRFGNDFEVYINDEDYQGSIKMSIFQIGEISNRLSEECKEKMKELPWREMYGLRNVIAHGYEQLIEQRIWRTVTKDIPDLKKLLTDTLTEMGEL